MVVPVKYLAQYLAIIRMQQTLSVSAPLVRLWPNKRTLTRGQTSISPDWSVRARVRTLYDYSNARVCVYVCVAKRRAKWFLFNLNPGDGRRCWECMQHMCVCVELAKLCVHFVFTCKHFIDGGAPVADASHRIALKTMPGMQKPYY